MTTIQILMIGIGTAVFILGTISIIINIFILALVLSQKRLRNLSVGRLIILTTVNDIFLCVTNYGKALEPFRAYSQSYITYRQCFAEQWGKF